MLISFLTTLNNIRKNRVIDSSKDLKLVLVGKTEINVEGREDVISLGFVDEADKYAAIAGAVALIQPSKI